MPNKTRVKKPGEEFEALRKAEQTTTGPALFDAKKKAASLGGSATISPDVRQGQIQEREQALVRAGVDVDTPDIQKRAILQQAIPQEVPSNVLSTTEAKLQEAGALDKVGTPRVELDPISEVAGKDLPVIGKSLQVLSGVSPEVKAQLQERIDNEIEVRNAREKELNKIKKAAFAEEISASEEMGITIEAIPVVGGLANKYAGSLVETPSENALKLQETINRQRERAVNLVEKTRSGAIEPEDSLMTLQQMQDNMAKMEGRLQNLITQSAILRANADQVNLIEEDIWRAKQVVEFSRQAVAIDMARKISGIGTPVPTEQPFFQELQGRKI